MNWGDRVKSYYTKLNTLQSQGWITATERSQANLFKSDQAFNTLVNKGISRRAAAISKVSHQAAMRRTGGLARPGKVIGDEYYLRYFGITKTELNQFNKIPVSVKQTYWKQGRGSVDKWHTGTPDLDYVVRQKWSSQYDPKYASQQLRGNKKWELQEKFAGDYIRQVKQYKATAGKSTPQFFRRKPQMTAAQLQRRKQIQKSWSLTGSFPQAMKGGASKATPISIGGRINSAGKIVKAAGTTKPFGSRGLKGIKATPTSVIKRAVGSGTRAKPVSRVSANGGTRATTIKKKKKLSSGTRAKRLN